MEVTTPKVKLAVAVAPVPLPPVILIEGELVYPLPPFATGILVIKPTPMVGVPLIARAGKVTVGADVYPLPGLLTVMEVTTPAPLMFAVAVA